MTTQYEVIVTNTSRQKRSFGNKPVYETFDVKAFRFDILKDVSKWLIETYGKRKRIPQKIFRDDSNKEIKHIGFIIGFWNSDVSHNSPKWFQQDWIEIKQVETEVTHLDTKELNGLWKE